jgi:uncharacterized phage infection (PIP) family protein YhgE
VGYGPKGTRPAGSLPVFTTNTLEASKMLVELACGTNAKGNYIAKELVEKQNMENLQKFSDRLNQIYEKYIKQKDEMNE